MINPSISFFMNPLERFAEEQAFLLDPTVFPSNIPMPSHTEHARDQVIELLQPLIATYENVKSGAEWSKNKKTGTKVRPPVQVRVLKTSEG